MSDIQISHADMRHLLSILAKEKPHHSTQLEAADLIANGLQIPRDNFFDRLRSLNDEDSAGVVMTSGAFESLLAAVETRDFTTMKNTERLVVVAECLGWKPDALMHHLKTTTGSLGYLALRSRLNQDYFDLCVNGHHREQWTRGLEARPGLYVIAGKPATGLSFAVNSTLHLLAGSMTDAVVHTLPEFMSFDGEQIVEAELRDISSAYAPNSILKGRVSTSDEFGMAFGMAKYFPVVVKLYFDRVEDALNVLNFYSDHNPGRMKAVLFQEIEPSQAEASHRVKTSLHTEERESWATMVTE